MEDLAASLMSHSHRHSAPLYLLYDVSSLTKHGLAPPVHDDDDDGFEFATEAKNGGGGGDAALRACASDVSAAAFADDLFRAGVLLPLRLPPRLQRPARSAGASAATSPTLSACRTKHRGFDPFAAALEKVREDVGAAPRRSRSLSPLRGSATATAVFARTDSNNPRAPRATAAQKASAAVATRPTWRARKGVKQLLCRAVMASAAAAPRALRPRKKDSVSYRPGLLECFGF